MSLAVPVRLFCLSKSVDLCCRFKSPNFFKTSSRLGVSWDGYVPRMCYFLAISFDFIIEYGSETKSIFEELQNTYWKCLLILDKRNLPHNVKKSYLLAYAPNEDSNQLAHPQRLV